MNEVMAPTQQWFQFLTMLDTKFGELDNGKGAPKEASSSASSAPQSGETTTESKSGESASKSEDRPVFSGISDGNKIPDAPMLDYERIQQKYRRTDPITEREAQDSISRLMYYAGKAFSKAFLDSGLSNALVVNKRRGKVFERSSVFEFKNQLLRAQGVETRGACHVRVVHPLVGAMEIYSLHLDHMWERNRRVQLDQLMEAISSPSSDSLPHIIMGDFNAITQSDYTPDYEDEMITTVRSNGRWEEPTYTLTAHMASLGYIDFWRRCNPNVLDADVTTCAYHTRIDYIWISKDLEKLIDWTHDNTYCHILNGVFHSDHFPVLANIQFKPKDAQ
jgi:endonuclease/exonuclease/phosphatase family metal-dependent hydrolase